LSSSSLSSKPQNEESIASPFRRFGLIAGNGRFPILFAQSAQKQGVEVIAIAHKGQTDPELEDYVPRIYWIKVGQLGKIIKVLKSEEVRDAALLGGINKTVMFTSAMPDLQALALIARLRTLNDDVLLRGICEEIEKQGITIHSSTLFLSELLSPHGCLTQKHPNANELQDIAFGWNLAKEIGRLDIGQTIIVKNKVVLAVEAIEGSDEAIRRAGKLGGGKGLIVVKVSKPQQDLRFDLPAVGPQTVAVMREAGANVLVIEQGKTILIDKDELIKAADEAKIVVVAQ